MKIVMRIAVMCVLMSGGVTSAVHAQNTTTRVSVSSAGAQASDFSNEPAITADGRYVAFVSRASNLVSRGHERHGRCLHPRSSQRGDDARQPRIDRGGGGYGVVEAGRQRRRPVRRVRLGREESRERRYEFRA